MTHKCAVGGCPNTSDTIIHYSLPEEPNRRRLWLQFIESSKQGENIPSSSRVCGNHFSEESFTKLNLGFTTRLILDVNAVPTIYPDGFTTLQEITAPENGMEAEDGNNILEAMSLACVKEEPLECELGFNGKKLGSLDHIKQEENEYLLAGEMNSHAQCEEVKREDGMWGFNEFESKPFDEDELLDHTTDKPYRCSYCGMGFRNRGVLLQHEVNHTLDSKVKQYRCHHCGKDFALKAFLKAHQKVHANVDPVLFNCSLCPRRFRTLTSRENHMRNHTVTTTYPCPVPVCVEEFKTKGALSMHFKSVHVGEKLPCNFCDKKFQKVDSYIKHHDSHTVVTPYYCSICNVYQITERGYLCHQRIHAQRRLAKVKGPNRTVAAEDKLSKDNIAPEVLQEAPLLEPQMDLELEQQTGPGIEPIGEFREEQPMEPQVDSEMQLQKEPEIKPMDEPEEESQLEPEKEAQTEPEGEPQVAPGPEPSPVHQEETCHNGDKIKDDSVAATRDGEIAEGI